MYTGEWLFKGVEQLFEALYAAIRFKMVCLAEDCVTLLSDALDEDPGGCLLLLDNQEKLSGEYVFLLKKAQMLLSTRLVQVSNMQRWIYYKTNEA